MNLSQTEEEKPFVCFTNLLRGFFCSIQTCLNKDDYFINNPFVYEENVCFWKLISLNNADYKLVNLHACKFWKS